MSKKAFHICQECGRVNQVTSNRCENCLGKLDEQHLVDVDGAVGLIGQTNSGKTTYLMTLFDQLMHSYPLWRVDVRDESTFRRMTNMYQTLRRHAQFAPTPLHRGFPDCFHLRVFWQRKVLDLVMWDAAGEEYSELAQNDEEWNRGLGSLLLECRAIFVAIHCRGLATLDMIESHDDPYQDDSLLYELFRGLTKRKNRLSQVIAVLVGSDLFGSIPDEATKRALLRFNETYRIFPGYLKSIGINFEAIAITNIGFGNKVTPEGLFDEPLRPYNILTPLQTILPGYLGWWDKFIHHPRKNLVATQAGPMLSAELATKNEEKIVQTTPQKLLRVLETKFSSQELQLLCFDLGVDYDSLNGVGKVDKARELIANLDRRGNLSKLLQYVSRHRPNAFLQ